MMLIYNLLKKVRVKNKRTNLGNIYLEKTYIIIISNKNVNTTWLIKKKVTSCGIFINCLNVNIFLYILVYRDIKKIKYIDIKEYLKNR